jgi:hypothetical protein
MRYIVLAGRVLYAAIFINSGFFHFSSMAIDYARSQGVPMASILVPLSGVMAIVGGLSIAFGFKGESRCMDPRGFFDSGNFFHALILEHNRSDATADANGDVYEESFHVGRRLAAGLVRCWTSKF